MELFYRKIGVGPDLVILHGLFGSSDNWMSIAKALENDFTVWTLDQRNHGQSPHDKAFNYVVMADDLADFLKQHSIKNPYLIGHSMGGKTVMEFLTKSSGSINKVIIADIGPKQYPLHHQAILEGLEAIDLESIKSRKEIDEQLSKYVPEFGVRAFLLKNIYRKENGNYDWRINLPIITKNIANVGDPQHEGRTYSGDILFLKGEKSNYILDEDFVSIKTIFPKAKLETIKNAGHWLHAEQPEAFLKELKGFFL